MSELISPDDRIVLEAAGLDVIWTVCSREIVHRNLQIERLSARIAKLEALLNEPSLADKLKKLGYKPHGKDIHIAALKDNA